MCPENVQEFEPYYTSCIISLGLIILQIGVFRFQESIDPRFFIPDLFLPPKYDYFRSINIIKKKLRVSILKKTQNKKKLKVKELKKIKMKKLMRKKMRMKMKKKQMKMKFT